MAAPGLKSIDLSRLTPGFHRHRFQVRGAGFNAFIWRGGSGPVLLVNGATHGDEYEGPTLLGRWAAEWRPARLRGTVVFVPVLNEAAFYAGQRCHPADNGNLARAFPGDPRGSVTGRLAFLFDTQLLAQCTHYVDLHSGGTGSALLRWTGYLTRPDAIGKVQHEMAGCFDDYWCWAAPFLPGRTLSAAYRRDLPAIYLECHGAGGVDPGDLRTLDRGLRRLLSWLGCTGKKGAWQPRPRRVRISNDAEEAHLQAHHIVPHDGLFVPAARLGQKVIRGRKLGEVLALDGLTRTVITAEGTGRIVKIRHRPSVQRGDAVCTLAPI